MNAQALFSEVKRFGGFLIVSGINTVFGYAAFAAFLFLGFSPSASLVCGYILGVAFNFGSLGSLFGSHRIQRVPHYLIVCGTMLVTNLLLLNGLIRLDIAALIAQGIAVAILAPVSFLLMRRFVFEGSL
jgi:putative flippase GtrA